MMKSEIGDKTREKLDSYERSKRLVIQELKKGSKKKHRLTKER
jgi:hypothetical protein